jgi:23S rRNA pseudouridine2605 synthase
MKVNPSRDTVRVDHRVVTPLEPEWILLHKPRGYVTTRDDPAGRRTIYDLLPDQLHHLFHVGRLDRDSSGALLLTNDGEAANRVLHPRYGTTKEYRADVEGRPDPGTLRHLVDGIELDDGPARVVSATFHGEVGEGVYRLILVLEEGRNREVRRLLEAVGHPVRRLFRKSFGPIDVGRLPPGRWRRLTSEEIATLRGETRPKRPR